MGKRIDAYLDTASFFSYIAFADLLLNYDKLTAHGIEVEFHPVLIAGINNLSGNTPPWMLPAKAKYLQRDTQRAADRVSKPNFRTPRDFIKAALTTSAQRALHHIKANYPRATFISAWHFLFHKFWTPPNVNLTVEENLRAALAAATETPAGGRRLFSDEDVRGIMDGREGMKEALKKETGRAVELGAFGAPWFWVTDAQGKGEAFFGSDRFNHIYKHLDIPFQDIAILPPSKL